MLTTHLLPPLIIILLFLLSIPNIRLVYQVQVQVSSVHIDFEMENLQISKTAFWWNSSDFMEEAQGRPHRQQPGSLPCSFRWWRTDNLAVSLIFFGTPAIFVFRRFLGLSGVLGPLAILANLLLLLLPSNSDQRGVLCGLLIQVPSIEDNLVWTPASYIADPDNNRTCLHSSHLLHLLLQNHPRHLSG